MDLVEKIRSLPQQPGCYLYKNAKGEVIYVGKAKNLRARVRSYLLASSQANAKTGSLMREAVDIEYILVGSEHEALALENNLIKQRQPRFNILLRDDKTYPYVKLTIQDRYAKVFVTRKLRKDGAAYYGPYFPSSLAWRVVELVQRCFLLPNCKIDLERYHPRACLQHAIHRCLGPCVKGLVSREDYDRAVKDARLLLEGKHSELEAELTERMLAAAEAELFEAAAKLRDQITTLRQVQEKQRAATTELGDDSDVFGYHFEDGMMAVNLFHVRGGKIVDRREFFWDELPERMDSSEQEDESAEPRAMEPAEVLGALVKQLYIDQHYVPRSILLPVDFEDRESLTVLLTEKAGRRVEVAVPQRGEKRSLVDLVAQNAHQSYVQRFRVLEPSKQAVADALADALMMPEPPKRIECFDISHIQGAETVASLVVWENGAMNKQAYRKFKVKTVDGVDDFASMREVIERRYRRLRDEGKEMPSLVLVDGGLGQLHSAAQALESVGLSTQPLASLAKREEVIYIYGQEEDPVVLDRRSPVLHVMQLIRDESHRFAIGYHRQRRQMRDRDSELLTVEGVGGTTRTRLLTHFGSLREVKAASMESLAAVVPRRTAENIWRYYHGEEAEAAGPEAEVQ